MADTYRALLTQPRVRRFVAAGCLGRLPMSMLGIGTVLLISTQWHSYALAGAVSATMLIAQSLTATRIGRLTDRYGQARVLRPLLAAHASALLGLVLLVVSGAPAATVFVLAAAAGGCFPPIGSLARARWVHLFDGADNAASGQRAAFSLEAALDELAYIVGPLIVAGLVGISGSAAGLLSVVVITVVGGAWFAAQRSTEPLPDTAARTRSPSMLRRSGMRMLGLSCLALGTVIGASEVSLVAFAGARHQPMMAGVLLALFSTGSVLAGLWYGSREWQAPLGRRLQLALVALLVASVPIALSGFMWLMVITVLLGGCTFAPTLIVTYELAEELTPDNDLTQGFAWLQTTLGAGLAVGAAVAGQAIGAAGARAGLIVAVFAAGIALAIVALGRAALRGHERAGAAVAIAPPPIAAMIGTE